MSFQIGDTIGVYKILGVVGRGGMGHVFKVEHTITRRLEAMKVLLRGQANELELSQRFLREVQVQASLNHPNIAAVYNAFSTGDELVMVMELVEGESLERLLERGRIPWRTAIGYACQALSALAYAHARGVTHRDIKPANIMITPAETIKLMDFGLAKAKTEQVRLTQAGAVMGSVYYMPPEQVKGVLALDARSDIYSLGVVLYEILTGSKPFEGPGAFAIMCGHVGETPAPPIDRNRGLPPALNDAILTALAKKPEERFASAGEFSRALERIPGSPGLELRVPWRLGFRLLHSRKSWTTAAVAGLLLTASDNVPRRPFPNSPAEAAVTPTTVNKAARAPGKRAHAPSSPPAGSIEPEPKRQSPRVVTIAEGTTLAVRTTLTLSTNTHQAGETFFAALQEPLIADGSIIAARGAVVEGQIEEADKGGRFKGRAWLAVRLTGLHTKDGGTVRITSDTVGRQGGGHQIGFLKRGGPAVLPAETLLNFRVLSPVTIREASPGAILPVGLWIGD